MKKFFAAVSILLLSLNLFAGVGSWQLANEEHYDAPDNESFMTLQAAFPQHFRDVDGTIVSSATLSIYDYEFVGPTQCPAGDPRLHTEVVAKSICYSGGMNCMASATPHPAPIDPCSY